MHAAAHVKGLNTYEDIKCPPTYETIEDADDMRIMNKTAQLMAECFWKFGANELELFGGSVLTEERFCALCSHIQFKGSAKGNEIEGFRKFLATEYIPQKYGGDRTYAHYIIGRPTDPDELDEISAESLVTEINTDSDYGIMFIYVKNSYVHKVWTSVLAGGGTMAATLIGGLLLIMPEPTITKLAAVAVISTASGVGGAAVGEAVGSEDSADWQSAVLLIPYDEENLKKLDCAHLPVKQGNK